MSSISKINRSIKLAAQEAERANREVERQKLAALKAADAAKKAEEKAIEQAARAAEADRKRLEKEAKAAHIQMREAEVAALNFQLQNEDEDLQNLLSATLDVDDFVDLEQLRESVQHPPFERTDLEKPLPPIIPVACPSEPEMVDPEPHKWATYFLGKKWRRKTISRRKALFTKQYREWCQIAKAAAAKSQELESERQLAEEARKAELDAARSVYQRECLEREAAVEQKNSCLDQLITNLSYGVKEAVEEYIYIVLTNSVYPDHFKVGYQFEFSGETAELKLKAEITPPESLNTVKAYRYIKTKDEISETQLSQKAVKDRYASAVYQVTLRTIHEIFEADRREIIKSISLEVGTEAKDPATGQQSFVTLAAIAAAREPFMQIDLSNVVPLATLEYLGAAVSKNPFALQPVTSGGVRRAK